MMNPKDHLIVALDVPEASQALDLVRTLKDEVGVFKIGLQLFTAYGPPIVGDVLAQGCRVFLDLKLHDIPNTVANAVTEAARLGVDMLTLHTQGGEIMMRRAREAADAAATGKALELLGVTVLTSLDQHQVDGIGYNRSIEDLVVNLARLADRSGMDGIVCSPMELDRLETEKLQKLFFVTPGIRPQGGSTDDQARTKTAGQAIAQGARYLVVGRPIIKAADPAQAARDFVEEIRAAKG